jgi:hypothetical protein
MTVKLNLKQKKSKASFIKLNHFYSFPQNFKNIKTTFTGILSKNRCLIQFITAKNDLIIFYSLKFKIKSATTF